MADKTPRLKQQHKDNILDVQKNLAAAKHYERQESRQKEAEILDNPKNQDPNECRAIPFKESCDKDE
jgi:hypothetical protein